MIERGKHRLIIFDADGTLRRCTVPGQKCPNADDQWELLPNVKEKFSEIDREFAAFGIASNQAGVHYGYLSERMAYRLLEDMMIEITGCVPPPGTIQMCTHSPTVGCACRKPRPLMLQRIMRMLEFSPACTLFIGDMEIDERAAGNAGCGFLWAHEFFGREIAGS